MPYKSAKNVFEIQNLEGGRKSGLSVCGEINYSKTHCDSVMKFSIKLYHYN